MIGKPFAEDLGLTFEPAECASVHNSIAIALEFGAVGMRRFRVPPASQFLNWKPQPQNNHFAAVAYVSASRPTAIRPIAVVFVRNGSSNLRASNGRPFR